MQSLLIITTMQVPNMVTKNQGRLPPVNPSTKSTWNSTNCEEQCACDSQAPASCIPEKTACRCSREKFSGDITTSEGSPDRDTRPHTTSTITPALSQTMPLTGGLAAYLTHLASPLQEYRGYSGPTL